MRRHDGFTLIELVVALMVGGMVLTGARQILDAVTDSARTAELESVTMALHANGDDLLRRLTQRLDIATPGAKPFFGTDQITEFSSWCEVPRGWLEPCTVVLTIDTVSAQPAVVAKFGDSTRVALLQGFQRATFRYLESADNGGTWQHMWGRGLSAPLAIGVILDRDTLIVPVGERG